MARVKFTAAGLRKAVERYFSAIARTATVTEPVDSGERDRKGRPIYVEQPVRNDAGELVQKVEYLVPPTVGGLCQALGITRATWANYSDNSKHPEFAETVRLARDRLASWLIEQVLTRDGRDTKGPMFVLSQAYTDYGFGAQRHEIDLGPRAREAMSLQERQAALREIMEELGDAREVLEDDGQTESGVIGY